MEEEREHSQIALSFKTVLLLDLDPALSISFNLSYFLSGPTSSGATLKVRSMCEFWRDTDIQSMREPVVENEEISQGPL
jgi:hypothetical protein